MTWNATVRFELTPAPGGLALVHDFLSTAATGRPRQPDLLESVDAARKWADDASRSWDLEQGVGDLTGLVISDQDLPHLRKLRQSLQLALIHRSEGSTEEVDGPSGANASISIEMAADGTVRVVPRGNGHKVLTGHILKEVHQAQIQDTWKRLKACRNEQCRATFYDRSRNNSGVWHDVHTCGNIANLRASRARKRAQTGLA